MTRRVEGAGLQDLSAYMDNVRTGMGDKPPSPVVVDPVREFTGDNADLRARVAESLEAAVATVTEVIPGTEVVGDLTDEGA